MGRSIDAKVYKTNAVLQIGEYMQNIDSEEFSKEKSYEENMNILLERLDEDYELDENEREEIEELMGIWICSVSKRVKTGIETRKERINMKVLPSIKAAATRRAEEQGRSLSNYVEQLILSDIGKDVK